MYVFENLDIYNKAVGFTSVVQFATESFPASTNHFSDRLNRSALAIQSNVAEAHGHWKDDERRDFFWKAREATQDCSGLLDIATRQGLISEGLRVSFRTKLDSLHKLILEALRKSEKKEEKSSEIAGPHGLRVF